MNTTIPEQYLTDYALNELGPEERIYVESLLGASEEAREDVYELIDLAVVLESNHPSHRTLRVPISFADPGANAAPVNAGP